MCSVSCISISGLFIRNRICFVYWRRLRWSEMGSWWENWNGNWVSSQAASLSREKKSPELNIFLSLGLVNWISLLFVSRNWRQIFRFLFLFSKLRKSYKFLIDFFLLFAKPGNLFCISLSILQNWGEKNFKLQFGLWSKADLVQPIQWYSDQFWV